VYLQSLATTNVFLGRPADIPQAMLTVGGMYMYIVTEAL